MAIGGISASVNGLLGAQNRLAESAQKVAQAGLGGVNPGNVAAPEVDLGTEAVNQQIATYDFKANLKALKVQDALERDVINILA